MLLWSNIGEGAFRCSLNLSPNVLAVSPIYSWSHSNLSHLYLYNTTLFGDMVLIFRCHQFILYSLTTLEMNLNAISFADVFEGFTKSFIIWNSYKVFMLGPIVLLIVVLVSWTVCLDLHSIFGPYWIFAGL